ncbi:MAG: VOC family protein [Actinobacteria bacterium]|nr:VOC family protein [Actinomycetota bacterium]
MTSIVTELVIDCADPERLGRFWSEALGYEIEDRSDDDVFITGPNDAPGILFLKTPDGKLGKNRVHLDVTPDGDQMEEVARLEQLGASRVNIGQGDRCSWIVMADPEGNEFCVLSPD